MKYIQIGEMALRMPNGEFKESVPICAESIRIPADIAEDFFEDKTADLLEKAYDAFLKNKALKRRKKRAAAITPTRKAIPRNN